MGAAAEALRTFAPSEQARRVATGETDAVIPPGEVVLYSHYSSICSQRARLTLVEKQVPFKSIMLHYDKLENVTPTYLGINPRGLVPTIIADGEVVFDSATIMRYVNNRYEGPQLLPEDTEDRSLVQSEIDKADLFPIRDMVAYVAKEAGTHGATYSGWGADTISKYLSAIRMMKDQYPDFSMNYALKLEDWEGQFGRISDQETMEKTKAYIERTMDDFESRLASQTYLVGDTYSLADVTWTPILVRLQYALGYDIWGNDLRPNLRRYFETSIKARPSFKSAIVDHYYNNKIPEGLA